MAITIDGIKVAGIGSSGKSAYEQAKAGGYTGTEYEFNQILNDAATKSYVNELLRGISSNSITELNKGLEQKFWRGTKSEYEAISTKDDSTMYIITDELEMAEENYMPYAIYDPQGKKEDIFDYVDKRVEASGQVDTHNADLNAHPDIREAIANFSSFTYGKEDLIPGESRLAPGVVYFVYE